MRLCSCTANLYPSSYLLFSLALSTIAFTQLSSLPLHSIYSKIRVLKGHGMTVHWHPKRPSSRNEELFTAFLSALSQGNTRMGNGGYFGG
ncbi:uncharacterized protein B0T23DRAFT_84530 [Neurospora hispaniola]|uniref:Uncharacterized protein n=1 Tax=Neurospora hispaniola TaxID=588809 RepID=A0AAJ0ICZ4_9PEZI|nr:hypothetical protein B0T23DRAFT_84530 [Neurospora hispaniola]